MSPTLAGAALVAPQSGYEKADDKEETRVSPGDARGDDRKHLLHYRDISHTCDIASVRFYVKRSDFELDGDEE